MNLKIFISYAPEDQTAKNELTKHLESMRKEGLIASWDKQQITAGTNRQQTIGQKLQEVQIILLLISSDAIASEYVFNHEIQKAIERHQSQTAVVIPILLRACDWTLLQEQNLTALPFTDPQTAVSSWKNKDEAYYHIVKNLRKTVVNFEKILGGQAITHFWKKAKPSRISLIAMILPIIISVALLTYFVTHLDSNPSNFNQTVLLRKKGVPFQEQGTLTLTYGKEQESLPIGNGKLNFPIENYQNDTAYFALQGVTDYELLHPDSTYILEEKKPITLQLTINKELLTVKGKVQDRQTLKTIPYVLITVENESFLTDSLGYFNKILTLHKPKNNYRLFAQKKGYQSDYVDYKPQSTDADIRLQKLNSP